MRICWVIVFLFSIGYSQTGAIKGIVVDKETKEGLPGVNVYLENAKDYGAATDADGTFIILNIPVGTYDLTAFFPGYEENKQHKDIELTSGKRLTLEIELAAIKNLQPHEFQIVCGSLWNGDQFNIRDTPDDEFLSIRNRGSSFSSAEVVEFDDASLSSGQNFTFRGTHTEEQLFLLNDVKLNDPFSSRLNFRLPALYLDFRHQLLSAKQPREYSTVGGAVFSHGINESHRKLNLRAVSSEITDNFGYNNVTGILNLKNRNQDRYKSLFVGASYLNTKDHTPSALGLNIPSTSKSEAALPNNNSKLVTGLAGGRVMWGGFQSDFFTLISDRKANNYLASYAKNNTAHFPRTESTDILSSLNVNYTGSSYWFIASRLNYRRVKSTTGDGVWFDDLEAYGDIYRNAERGIILPGPGQQTGRDSLDIFFDNGRVNDFFQKSQSQTLSGQLKFFGMFNSILINSGVDFERHQLRYYDIEPVSLATIPSDKTLAYGRAVGRFYGYNFFGEELNSRQFRTIEDGLDLRNFEESASKTPRNIGLFTDLEIWDRQFKYNFSLRYDNFNPASRRIKNLENFYEAGASDFLLDEEDFENAPSDHSFSPQLTITYQNELNYVQLNAQIVYQTPPLMFYYDSWNNLDGNFGQDRPDILNTGHLSPVRYDKLDLLFVRFFLKYLLNAKINLYYQRVNNPLVQARRIANFVSLPYTYETVENSEFAENQWGVNLDLVYSMNEFDARLSYNASYHPSAIVIEPQNINSNLNPVGGNRKWQQSAKAYASILLNDNLRLGTQLRFQKGHNHLDPYNQRALLRQDIQNYFGRRYYVDLKSFLQLDMNISYELKLAGSNTRPFLSIENILNRKNFYRGWPLTGEPDVDGLEEAVGIDPNNALIASEYSAFINDPAFYARPRIIRVGLSIDY